MKFARCFTMITVLMGAQAFLPAAAASFDCKKATSKVEKLICQSPELSKLDNNLARTYKSALVSATDKVWFKKDQMAWLKYTRNGCPTVVCLDEAYKARIAVLGIPAVVLGFEEEKAREQAFIAKAQAGEMNCSHEAQTLVDAIPGKLAKLARDVTQNIFIYECLRGMLKAQRFDEAQRQIETLGGNPQIWGMRILRDIAKVPVYATVENPPEYFISCKTRYAGSELEQLTFAVLNRVDLNRGDPSDSDPHPHSRLFGYMNGLSILVDSGCINESQVIHQYNLLLDDGLRTTLWTERGNDMAYATASIGIVDARGSGWNGFASIMWLGDEALARRILKGGITTGKNTRLYLFARAPTMKMVRVLEEYGFRLKPAEFRQVLKLLDLEMNEGGLLPDEEVMHYYQSQSTNQKRIEP